MQKREKHHENTIFESGCKSRKVSISNTANNVTWPTPYRAASFDPDRGIEPIAFQQAGHNFRPLWQGEVLPNHHSGCGTLDHAVPSSVHTPAVAFPHVLRGRCRCRHGRWATTSFREYIRVRPSCSTVSSSFYIATSARPCLAERRL